VARGAPDRPVFVQGHADAAGPEVRSQQLSELRAEVVRSLLVQAGVDATNVHAIGFGAGRPVATNETAAGRALNRRVEIVIGESEGIGGRP
jgi:outer membrane protein OmpA-like peptidoglycan-associated protein